MEDVRICLNNIQKVCSYLNMVSHYDSDVTVIGDRMEIDGKSAIGIFSLDLSKPFTIRLSDEGGGIKEVIKKFMV
ncbi:MAG: HPr family phosphocarrier protein [Agathobacter sp.]|nr:HPr family phosphocarrier protein [Agathobacter sp.]MEE1304149.1 HPr family phosphocarrier protein [Agathobacter sp.]